MISACTTPSASAPDTAPEQGFAVYLYPGSKAEIIRDGHCTLHENLLDDAVGMAPPIDGKLSEPRINKDQNGREVWKVTSCD